MNILITIAARWLELFRLPEDTPPPRKAKPKQPAPVVIVCESRTQLENRAANIMTAAGARFDVWGTVRSMTNNELNEIVIRGY